MTRIIIVTSETGKVTVYSNEQRLEIDTINMAEYDEYYKGEYEEECDELLYEIKKNNLVAFHI